jgi:hypothetical protein
VGDIGFAVKDQGLAYLEAVIVEVARARLREAYPEVAAAIQAVGDPEEAARLAGEAGVSTKAVTVLNEILGLEIAVERLTNALSVASLLPQHRSHAVSMLAEDTLSIALSAVVDSLKRTVEVALTTFVGEDGETRPLRQGVRAWSKAAKQQLSTSREAVAHGEPFHMRDFGHLKIWEGAILLGLDGPELFRFVAGDQLRASHEALERRVQPLQQLAALLIAKVFAECRAVAELLERRCLA